MAGPLVFTSSTAVLSGAHEQVPVIALAAALPVFVRDMSLAGWLMVKGFMPTTGSLEPTDTLVRGGVA